MALAATITGTGPCPLLPDRRRTGGERWRVLHVKSRQEKVLSAALDGMGIDHYLPIVRRVRYHGRQKARVSEPLFPGYLFLWGTLDDAYRADRTRRVVALIEVRDQERLERELGSVHDALARAADLEPHPALEKGVRVAVRSGPLKGIEGVVESRMRTDRRVLQVGLLGSAVSLEIERSLLTVLD